MLFRAFLGGLIRACFRGLFFMTFQFRALGL